jgi:hypothetical protein
VITFDSLGNATFAGTVSAKEIKVGDVSGIQAITDQINELAQGQVAFTLTAEVMNTLSSALTLAQADILKLQTDLATATTTILGLTTSGEDMDTRIKVVEALLTKNEEGIVTGFSMGTLTVSGNSSFGGEAKFEGLSFFSSTTEFASGVLFKSKTEFVVPPLYNKDSAGYALIKQGDRRVEVAFAEPYIATPVVNTSVTFEEEDLEDDDTRTFFADDIRFIVMGKNQDGFIIVLNKPATRDIRFSWNALAVRDPSVFESIFEGLIIDGTPPPTEETPVPEPTPSPAPDEVNPEPNPTPDPEVTPEPEPEPTPSPDEASESEGGAI